MLGIVIPPIALLDDYKLQAAHLLLPQLTSEARYVEWVKSLDSYTILDNGAAESKRFCWTDLLTIAGWLDVNELVLPDYLYDADTTITAVRDCKPDVLHRREMGYTTKVQAVIQGTNLAEWKQCLDYYVGEPWIDVIAFPRLMNLDNKMQRLQFIQALIASGYLVNERPFEMHCLGSSEWVREVVALTETPVRSMDTSMPCHLAMEGRRIRDNEYVRRPSGYFEWEPTTDERALAIFNTQCFYDWAEDETSRCEM